MAEKGAIGTIQLLPTTCWKVILNIFIPDENIAIQYECCFRWAVPLMLMIIYNSSVIIVIIIHDLHRSPYDWKSYLINIKWISLLRGDIYTTKWYRLSSFLWTVTDEHQLIRYRSQSNICFIHWRLLCSDYWRQGSPCFIVHVGLMVWGLSK